MKDAGEKYRRCNPSLSLRSASHRKDQSLAVSQGGKACPNSARSKKKAAGNWYLPNLFVVPKGHESKTLRCEIEGKASTLSTVTYSSSQRFNLLVSTTCFRCGYLMDADIE
jgi:hypothetical protein